MEEGTGTMEKDVRSWRRARHAVARGRPLEEKTDRWSWKILVGDGWLLEEGTSCCSTRLSVGGEDRQMELQDSCRRWVALGRGNWFREESKSRRRRQASGR